MEKRGEQQIFNNWTEDWFCCLTYRFLEITFICLFVVEKFQNSTVFILFDFFPHFPYLFLTFLCINRLLKRCLEWLNHYQIIFNHCQSIRVSQLDTYYLMFFVLKNYLNICINKWSVKLSRVFCFSSINEWLIDL